MGFFCFVTTLQVLGAFLERSLCKSPSEPSGLSLMLSFWFCSVWPVDSGQRPARRRRCKFNSERGRSRVGRIKPGRGTEEPAPHTRSRLFTGRLFPKVIPTLWCYFILLQPPPARGVSALHNYGERFASDVWPSNCGLDSAAWRKSRARQARLTRCTCCPREQGDNQTSGASTHHISILLVALRSRQQTIAFLQCNEMPDGFKRPALPPRRHTEY